MKKNAMYSNLESVEQLFRQYYKVLRVYAFRFVNDWDVAEDIVQDVLLLYGISVQILNSMEQ